MSNTDITFFSIYPSLYPSLPLLSAVSQPVLSLCYACDVEESADPGLLPVVSPPFSHFCSVLSKTAGLRKDIQHLRYDHWEGGKPVKLVDE